ncbi:hypothetical protein Goklo_004125 [Gossypium klotzschianum]|uniref:Uncharacterized protein n=1 Tax=Gossypium klotzschianum TaxID=34286 RepID=A0A7J8VN98_9ROSI|nr:hypothetical protein [Gossypium klotzschianum]
MWDNKYVFLPSCEAIVASELDCNPDYMSWFRTHGKPYLYRGEARIWKSYTRRPRWAPIQPRTSEAGISLAPTQEKTSMTVPPTGQYVPSNSGSYTNYFIFTQAPYIPPHFYASTSMLGFVFGPPSMVYYTSMPFTFSTKMMPTMTYRSSIFRAPTRNDCTTKVDNHPNHQFLDRMVHNGNREAINCSQLKAKKMRGRDHNLNRRLNQEGIRCATVNHPDVAQILTDIWTDLLYHCSHHKMDYNKIDVNDVLYLYRPFNVNVTPQTWPRRYGRI